MIGRWVEQARCAEVGDVELFYPESRGGLTKVSRQVQEICGGCEVIAACLEWALRNGEVGIWGGTTENQRRRIRRNLNVEALRAQRFVEHGTPAGARAHYRRGEKPCESCLEAAARSKRRH